MANVFDANIFDDSRDLEHLAKMERALKALDDDGEKAGKRLASGFNNADKAADNFNRSLTQTKGGLDAIGQSAIREVNALEKARAKYAELKKAAESLREAAKNATDPRAALNYAKALGQAEAGMKRLDEAGKSAGVNLKTAVKETGGLAGAFKGAFAALGVGSVLAGVFALTKQAVQLAAQYEKVKASFTAFLGSAEQATKVLGALSAFAAETPLDTGQVQEAGKALLGFGESASNLVPVLERIGNIAAGTGKDFNELTLIYGKARTAGVLYAEDLNQLIEAGVPIVQELSKNLGISTAEVKKFASEGLITFKDLEVAFFNLSTSSGKFAGQMEAQAETLAGKWDIFLSKLKDIGRTIGEQITPFLKSALDTVSKDLDQVIDDFTHGFDRFNDPEAFKERARKQAQAAREAREIADREEETIQRKFYQESEGRKAELQAKAAEKAAKDQAAKGKKLQAERERIEKEARELAALRIQAMKEGEAKELAVEQARYDELIKQLNRFGIATGEATEQHLKNVLEIRVKYLKERLDKIAEAQEAEKRLNEEGFKALEDAEKAGVEALLKARQEGQAAIQKANAETDALQSAIFEESETNLRAVFFSRKRTSDEIDKFEREAAKRRELFQLEVQKKELERTLQFGSELSSTEKASLETRIRTINEQIRQVTNGIGNEEGGKVSLFDLLGIDLGDGQEGAITEALGQAFDAINTLTEASIKAAEARTAARQKEVDETQRLLDKELELAEKGEANNVDLLKRQLAEQKQARDKALQDEAKARRSQILLDSAQQIASLITASANIFKSLSAIPFVGVPLAIATIGLMFAAFAKTKSDALKAAQVPKLRRGESPGERIKGPSHERGGVLRELEGDEWVIGTKHSREHNRHLERINRGEYAGRDLERELSKPRRNPVSEAAPRIRQLEAQSREATAEAQYKAMVRAYQTQTDRVVREIQRKPNVYPRPNGFTKEVIDGNSINREHYDYTT
jgi:tape measure domain-containing protein